MTVIETMLQYFKYKIFSIFSNSESRSWSWTALENYSDKDWVFETKQVLIKINQWCTSQILQVWICSFISIGILRRICGWNFSMFLPHWICRWKFELLILFLVTFQAECKPEICVIFHIQLLFLNNTSLPIL